MKRKSINPELERKIDLYVNGRLNERQIDDLWTELIQDDHAIEYLKTVANLKHISVSELREKRGGGVTGQKRFGWIYAAAALILVAGAFSLMRLDPETVSVEPIASIELDYYRSSDGMVRDLNGEEEVIREAIVLANEGKHLEAVQLIEEEVGRTLDVNSRAQLFINAGSILYNISMFQEAADRFEKVVALEESNLLVRERAYWYLGNTYFQLNRLDAARNAFQSAHDLNGAYSRIAQSYLSALSGK